MNEDKDTAKFPRGAVIMGGGEEPLQGITIEDWEQQHNLENESELADALAGAWNQAGWLMHDLDDADAPDKKGGGYP